MISIDSTLGMNKKDSISLLKSTTGDTTANGSMICSGSKEAIGVIICSSSIDSIVSTIGSIAIDSLTSKIGSMAYSFICSMNLSLSILVSGIIGA